MEWASLVSQLVQSLTAMQETRVRFLGREDPLDPLESRWPKMTSPLLSPSWNSSSR